MFHAISAELLLSTEQSIYEHHFHALRVYLRKGGIDMCYICRKNFSYNSRNQEMAMTLNKVAM